MKVTFLIVSLFGAACVSLLQEASASPYTFVCEDKKCVRKLKEDGSATETPMDVCKLNCDDLGSLWPKPTGQVSIGKEIVSIHPDSITLENLSSNPAPVQGILNDAFNIFLSYLPKMNSSSTMKEARADSPNKLQIRITVSDSTTELGLNVNETYTLKVSSSTAANIVTVVADILAPTFFGARHALETLSQLIAYDNVDDDFKIVSSVDISDGPVFPYRGVMMDTSRNFFSVEKIKKLIDGMSYNKLSVFHWHITDTHSFPMQVPRRPKMVEYGAYRADKIYSVQQIKDIVSYAKQRGIKVIPELDQPAHSGYGYQWGVKDNLGDLVVCLESEPWYDYCVEPPCGQLNLVNENVTDVIGDIYADMLDMFDNDIFHMGGDEVDFRCYNSTKQITDYMKANDYPLTNEGFYRLWGEFQEKVLQKLLDASSTRDTKVIMWTSGLTHPDRIEQYLDKSRYIIQIWSESTDDAIGGVLQKGYQTLFSNVDALYLDCGWQAWLGNGHNWCSPVKGWQTVYDNNPEKIYAKFTNDSVAGDAVRNGQIVGSETPLWAEQADDHALESRIFPRAAAHAERLWSHPETTYAEAEYRMVTNRDRLVTRGIAADRLQPEFCQQNQGKCYAEIPAPPPVNETNTTPSDPNTTPSAASIQQVSFVTFLIGTVMMIISQLA